MKTSKSSAEKDMQEEKIEYINRNDKSDLIHAMEILHSDENLESNTILTNEQVNGLVLMNWASQVYKFDFFRYYVALFPKYRISGDDGRGRSELIQIAEAIQRDKAMHDERYLNLLGQRKL